MYIEGVDQFLLGLEVMKERTRCNTGLLGDQGGRGSLDPVSYEKFQGCVEYVISLAHFISLNLPNRLLSLIIRNQDQFVKPLIYFCNINPNFVDLQMKSTRISD